MENEEKELLHKIDERTENIQTNVTEVKSDLRAEREVGYKQRNEIDQKASKANNRSRSNKIKIGALSFLATSALSAGIANYIGLITL